jgi:DNA adenine methylase
MPGCNPIHPRCGGELRLSAQLRLLDIPAYRLAASPVLVPFLKWPGGKSQEMPAIAAAAPELTGRFIDPFVGGGSVLLAVPEEVEAWANDAAEDLLDLYRAAAEERPAFRNAVVGVAHAWDALRLLGTIYRSLAYEFLDGSSGRVAVSIACSAGALDRPLTLAGPGLKDAFATRLSKDLPVKFGRMRQIQRALGRTLTDPDLLANVEGAVRAAFYMAIRARYNRARLTGERSETRLADFFFLREFAYAAMFRFNSRGEFNVPYGGISYNRKSLSDKVEVLFGIEMLGRLKNTTWRSLDFEPFVIEADPEPSDFLFVDPPYDSDFSDYDNLPFGQRDQERLQQILESLDAKVMVVIKDTPLVRHLYRPDRWRVAAADKTYMWTIKSRNDREATHLTITNY